MKRILLFLILLYNSVNAQSISTAKPWTYWWWMGSAVTKKDIIFQLQNFQKAGLGGVHIIPIYGVKGREKEFKNFLSPEWLNLLEYTVAEGKKIGLGVDLTTGTGWPFGGPNVTSEMGAKIMQFKNGEYVVDNTNQKVKRAAPGGEGLVLDPFGNGAMPRYLARFDSAFKKTKYLPRSMYMDSYEAYGANWTKDFPIEFRKRRGYEVNLAAAYLQDTLRNKESDLYRIDYQQTIAELLLERYAYPWTSWSSEKKFLTRYQAHGSPGNLLDLYAQADIPETESFGTSRFDIPGLRVDPDYSVDQFGTPDILAMKFASSAANITGKRLVSSETGTWLANHFKVSLSQVKPQIDELFTAGINHIFYHGTTYSPQDAPYPGWLFYASTNFGPMSHFAREFPLLNGYVEKCQKILQESKPDNDILVYFPIQDLWATPSKSAGGVHLLEVHHVDRWLFDLPFGKLSRKLLDRGYTFDYISDRQLEGLSVEPDGSINTSKGIYKTLLIPSSTYMPEKTFNRIVALGKKGAKIIFENKMPDMLSGHFGQNRKESLYKTLGGKLKRLPSVFVTGNLDEALLANHIKAESLAAQNLRFIRKKRADGKSVYFVANLSNKFTEGWIALNKLEHVQKYDPLSGYSNLPFRREANISEVYLILAPGESCFLQPAPGAGSEPLKVNEQKAFPISSEWNIKFDSGKPDIHDATILKELTSWTTFSDSAKYFSGSARYSTRFDLPALTGEKEIYLDLGDVRESAEVWINNKKIGTAWSIPFRLKLVAKDLKPKDNTLEIIVTNLSANYMRLRDNQVPDWKIFYDINIVDITYKKFDASQWAPMPSGLLGPVRILYR